MNRNRNITAIALLVMLAMAWSGTVASAYDGPVRYDDAVRYDADHYEAVPYDDAAKAAAFELDLSDTEGMDDMAGGSSYLAIESIVPSVEAEPQYALVTEYDTIRTRSIATRYLEFKFRFDKYDLDMNYMENRNILDEFNRILDSIGVENITKLAILSQSSPEGVYEHNIWLSEKRSATMNDFMQDNYPELTDILDVNPDGESWQALREYVLNDSKLEEASKNKIIDVIDANINVGTKKWRMENVLGSDANVGNIYKYLYRTYYPRIRFSGVTIDHYTENITLVERPHEEPVAVLTPDTTHAEVVLPALPVYERYPKLAVKTNLLYDAVFTPKMGYAPVLNVELEYYLTQHGRWSLLGEYEFPWWSKEEEHQYLQLLNWQMEGRRYFKKDSGFTGHYLSGYAGYNLFDLCFDDESGHGVQGEGAHIGLGYGYVLPLNKKGNWKLELFLKGGFYLSHYDKYDAGNPHTGKYYYHWFDDPDLFQPRNWRLRWFGPTGAGITLSYDLIYRKRQVVDIKTK